MKKRGIICFVLVLSLFLKIVSGMPIHPDLYKKADVKIIEDNTNREVPGEVKFNMKNFISRKSGTTQFKILAVLVDFNDKPAQVPATFFDGLVFNDSKPSLKHFYLENSYGQLELTTFNLPSSLGWERAISSYYKYVGGVWNGTQYVNCSKGLGIYPNNTQKLFEEIVDMVDPYVNFAEYDNNGDGYVDGVLVGHAGRGYENSFNSCDIHSHKWGIAPVWKDGVRVSTYSMQPEYWVNPGDMTIGVYAHETGHLFGLPDLYSLSGYGLGTWSLMAWGGWNGARGSSPAHFDAWSKSFLGLATPQTITSSGAIVNLPTSTQNPVIYKLWKDNNFGDEYFLIENRQKILYDTYIPGSGLLVYHVDENTIRTRGGNYIATAWWPGRDPANHYGIALESADGLWEIEKSIDQGDANDPYPGGVVNREFSLITVPDSTGYLSGNSYVKVEDISNSGSTMTARLSVSSSGGQDPIPPTVSITSPAVGQTFTGNTSLDASASDNVGINKVEFYFDGNLIGQDTFSPYNFIWNSKSTSPGTHTLYAKAIDTSGNSANSQALNINTKYCGDLDKNNIYDILDVTALVSYVFKDGAAPVPLVLGDTNADGIVDVLDVTALVDYVFRGGNPPASCNLVVSQTSALSQVTKPSTKTTTTSKRIGKRSISAKVIDDISDFDNGIGLIIIIILVILGILIMKSVKKDRKKAKHRRR